MTRQTKLWKVISKYDRLPDHFHNLQTTLQTEFSLLKKATSKNIENLQDAANNLKLVSSSSYAGCFCLVCWFSCSFVSEACACFGEWLREVVRVETFVRVLRSSRVNLKINVNNTNVFHCVLIKSLLFYFCCSFQAVLQK